MHAVISAGNEFHRDTALYSKDRCPTAELKAGMFSFSLFLVFISCTDDRSLKRVY